MTVSPIATTAAVTAALKPGTLIGDAHPQLHVTERAFSNAILALVQDIADRFDVDGKILAAALPDTGVIDEGELAAALAPYVTDSEDAAAIAAAIAAIPAPAWGSISSKPSTFAPSAHKASHAIGGSDPLTPADIGAGTSNLALGTTSSTAKRGDYQPTAADISNATTVGQAVITAATQALARSAIGAGTSSLALGTTGSTAKAGDYAPAVADVVGLVTALGGKAGVDATGVDANGYGTLSLTAGSSTVTVPLKGWTIPGVTGPTEVYYSDFYGWNSGVTADRRAALSAAMTAATTGRQRPVAFVPNPSGTRWYFGGATEGQLPIPAQGLHLKGLSSSAGPLERDDQVTLLFDNVGDIFAWPAGDYYGYTQDNICLSGAQVAGGAGTTTFFDQIGTGRRLFDFRFINGASFKFFQHVIRGSLGRGDFGGGQAWHINGGGGTQLHLFGSDFHFTGMLYLDQFPMSADQSSVILENVTLADFRAYITPAPHMGLYVKACKDVDIDCIINGLNDHTATAYANTAAFPAAASSLHLLAKDTSSGITYRSNGTNWSEVYRNASAATSGSTFPGSPTAGAMHYLTGAGLDSNIDAFRYDSAGARWHGPMFRPAVTGDVYYDGASGPLAMFEGCQAIRASMRLRAGGLKAWSFQKGTVMVLNPPSGSELDMDLTQEYLLPVQDVYSLLVQAGYGGGGARWKLRDLISAQHPGGAPTIYAAVSNSGSAYPVYYEREEHRVVSGAGKTTVASTDWDFRFPPPPGAEWIVLNTTDGTEKRAFYKQNGTWTYLTPA